MVYGHFQKSTSRFKRRISHKASRCCRLNGASCRRRLGRKLGQISFACLERWQLSGRAAVVELGCKLCLRRQWVTFNAIEHITFKEHTESALLRL
jgi:hypothetical protein